MMIAYCVSSLANICFLSLLTIPGATSNVYYCQDGVTQVVTGHTEGVIKTRQTEDDFSGNNLLCSWIIEAGVGNRVQLTVDVLDLQWSPQYTTCTGYDNLQIVEGKDRTGPQITSVCHARNPYNVVSKGSALFLQMSTTPQDFSAHKGIEMTFQIFSNSSCPPGWFQSSDMAATCLMIGSLDKLEWKNSHHVCALSLANLASVLSAAEYQAILDHGRNQSTDMAWIGLSDLIQERTFKWVDNEPLNYERTITNYGYRTHCIAQDFSTGHWKALNCDNKLNYICKANKDGSTVLYPAVPVSPPPDEGPGGSKVYLVVIIVVAVIAALGVFLLVYVCYCRRNNKCKNNKHDKHTGGSTSVELTNRSEPAEPSAPPAVEIHSPDSQMVAPPSYEESRTHPIIH